MSRNKKKHSAAENERFDRSRGAAYIGVFLILLELPVIALFVSGALKLPTWLNNILMAVCAVAVACAAVKLGRAVDNHVRSAVRRRVSQVKKAESIAELIQFAVFGAGIISLYIGYRLFE